MKLETIWLEKVTSKEFEKMHKFWYDKLGEKANADTANIMSPYLSESYDELIYDFLEHEHANKICFVRSGKFDKHFVDKIHGDKKAVARDFANQAKQASDKTGHLELEFKLNKYMRECARIRFAERNGILIGYSMKISKDHLKFFSWRRDPMCNPLKICALASPKPLYMMESSGKYIIARS